MTVLTHTTNQLKSLLEKITPSHRSTHLQVDQQAFRQGMSNPVSYTHLTLPTILLV